MKPLIKVTSLSLLVTAVVAFASIWLTGCEKNQSAQAGQLYTCGMHPQVIQNKPGNCPICGMKLTPVRKQGVSSNATQVTSSTNANMSTGEAEGAPVITIDPATTQNMGLRTGIVSRGPLRRTIRTVGIIDY